MAGTAASLWLSLTLTAPRPPLLNVVGGRDDLALLGRIDLDAQACAAAPDHGRRPQAKLEKMQTLSGDFELTMDELRAVAAYGVACAEPALVLFQKARPDDARPAAALHAARVFAEGAPRSRLQRTAAADAHRAARDAPTEIARHAAGAAGDAAAAAYLHPLAKATQVRHILGSAAHAARAAELARGDDPVVAEYVITAAAKRATPVVLDVLTRYPRAPKGRTPTCQGELRPVVHSKSASVGRGPGVHHVEFVFDRGARRWPYEQPWTSLGGPDLEEVILLGAKA